MRYTCQTSPRFIKKPFFNIHPITQSVLVIIGMSMTGVSAHAAASEAANGETESTLPSLTFTTTATKTPTLVKNTIAQTTVIDEEQLQRYRGQSVIDVLRSQGGIYVTQNGGDGASSGVRLRGYSNSQVLVLIDGIRYSSATAGGSALSLLPVDQIDRIEIVYGASGSSLYGSDAMGGVIQVFTKGQNAQQSNVALTVGGGTENSYKGQITGQYVNDSSTLSLSAGYDKTNGINATKTYAPFNSYFADKDGFESKNASFVAKHKINNNLNVGMTGLYAISTSDLDNGKDVSNAYADQKNEVFNGFANYDFGKLTASLKYGQSFDKSTTYDGADWQTGRLDDVFNTTQKQANLQLGYKLPFGQIIGGYEHLKQEVDSSVAFAIDNRTIKSVYAGYLVNNHQYDGQLNIRYDDNSQFGNETTYNVGVAYRIMPNVRVGASYATNFRAPTFNDLYYPDYSNSNLKSETSKNSEIFVEHSNNLQKTRVTTYQSDIKNKIQADENYIPQNIAQAKIKGVNLQSDWHINNLLFGFNYDYTNAEDKATELQLTYQPKNKGLVYVGYQKPTFDIRLESQYVGDRDFMNSNNFPSTRETLDSYMTLNLSGNYYLSSNLTINSRLNNLTDKDYETVYGYRQKGINSFVSLTYQWF
nr:TonB-dependent receptor [Moraxella osloensis]